jgi:phosphoribosyl 1,2-cyclic phosphodiesterase
MRVWVLGSGSRGNAVVVEADGSRILVDAGFHPRELGERLGRIDIAPESIEGVVITHEHGDHVRGAAGGARRWGWGLHASAGTRRACPALAAADSRSFEPGSTFELGGFQVHVPGVSHDAEQPVAVVLTARGSGARVAVAYDLGYPSRRVAAALADLDVLVLEANHDEQMLWTGPYPPSVCERIASRTGHLSNAAAGALAAACAHRRLRQVVLAHLSDSCNDAVVARRTVATALERTAFRGRIDVAKQEAVVGPFAPGPERRAGRVEQLALGL